MIRITDIKDRNYWIKSRDIVVKECDKNEAKTFIWNLYRYEEKSIPDTTKLYQVRIPGYEDRIIINEENLNKLING